MSAGPAAAPDALTVRTATESDIPGILALATRCLGWLGDEEDEAFFRWKHLESPFGRSPMLVAEDRGRVVALRTFMPWELVAPDRRVVRAARAVDTATDPQYQGRGLFTRLTLQGLDDLARDGVDLVFNTPNSSSLPGYLKMGWQVVGRLPVTLRPARLSTLRSLPAAARAPATRSATAIHAGLDPAEAFGDDREVAALLAAQRGSLGWATHRSADHLRWRYGLRSLHYRVLLFGDELAEGAVVFHVRRRGPCVEAVVGATFAPGGSTRPAAELRRRIARLTGADYVLQIDRRPLTRDGFVRVPRLGPLLVARPLRADVAVPRLAQWRLTMGDVELF